MTGEEIQKAMDEITARYWGKPICETTEVRVRADVAALVRRVYAEGGRVADTLGKPIEHFDDVAMAITMSPITRSVSVTVVRRSPPPPEPEPEDQDDAGPLHFARSPLVPTSWAVRCPGCEELIEVADTDVGDPEGSTYMVDASTGAPWIRCDDCGTLIEIVGVKVDQVIPTPGIRW